MNKIKQSMREIFARKGRMPGLNLQEMSSAEKKNFLSMDIIERMIRVEQRISASLGELVPYDKTRYYKNLPENQRKAFQRYLIKNKRKKFLLTISVILPVMLLFIMRVNLTGNVVRDSMGNFSFSLFETALIILIILILFFVSLVLIFDRLKEHKFKQHEAILYNAMSEHSLKKRLGKM